VLATAEDRRHLRAAERRAVQPELDERHLQSIFTRHRNKRDRPPTPHWFGTEVYANTHDIRVTQELLGHQSPNTTAGYVAYSHVAAAEAVGSLRLRA
jgi:integrase/recombinase XerC